MAGNGHDCFQNRSPWTAPLKEGATIHHLKVVCCALPGASCGKRMIARSVPASANHHRGSYTSPALAAPATPLWTCRPGTPCVASCSRSASLQFISFHERSLYCIMRLTEN